MRCYVPDKPRLIAEAARIVRPGGVIAFTDWVEGPARLTDSEAQRFLATMMFANVEDITGYAKLLSASGCEVSAAEDTWGALPAIWICTSTWLKSSFGTMLCRSSGSAPTCWIRLSTVSASSARWRARARSRRPGLSPDENSNVAG